MATLRLLSPARHWRSCTNRRPRDSGCCSDLPGSPGVEYGKGLPKSDLDTIVIHRRHISRRKLGAFFAEVKPGTDRSIDVSLLPMSEHKRLCCHTHRLPVRTVSRRYNEAWISLPEHLHYTLECWGTDLPASVKLMLLISYLAYLYNELLVQSLLSKDSGETGASHLD